MYAGKLLVVFYSRTRTTRRAASALAGMLDADVEEIVVTRGRAGPFGYLRSLVEAINQKPARCRSVRVRGRRTRLSVDWHQRAAVAESGATAPVGRQIRKLPQPSSATGTSGIGGAMSCRPTSDSTVDETCVASAMNR
ncbi:hypothetical protein [Burkholderia ambifaria]|uniref:hypothetical protein n=1 Tax=Burkholderia ambifaria TaxID=152480 RepID=UPI003C7C4A4F